MKSEALRRGERVVCSFFSLVVSAAVCGAVVAGYTLYTRDPATFVPSRILLGVVLFGSVTLFLSTPGYALFLVLALTIRNLQGYRFWLVFALGSLLGPFSLTVVWLFENWRVPDLGGWEPLVKPMMIWALSVSTLATLLYLGAARLFHLHPATKKMDSPTDRQLEK